MPFLELTGCICWCLLYHSLGLSYQFLKRKDIVLILCKQFFTYFKNGNSLTNMHVTLEKRVNVHVVQGIITKTFLLAFVRCFKSSFPFRGNICKVKKFNN